MDNIPGHKERIVFCRGDRQTWNNVSDGNKCDGEKQSKIRGMKDRLGWAYFSVEGVQEKSHKSGHIWAKREGTEGGSYVLPTPMSSRLLVCQEPQTPLVQNWTLHAPFFFF